MEEALYEKEVDGVLYIKGSGHVTAKLCTDVRKEVFERIDEEPRLDSIYIELSDCDYMDSTFMGLLVGFNKRFKKMAGKPIEIVQPSSECVKLLKGLGIFRLLRVTDKKINMPKEMKKITENSTATAEMVLRAHENLIEISDENREKFRVLHSILKKQAEQEDK
ncbi:MAG: STAS domain-containing protein [Spirochaetia bacterium]